MTAGRFTRAEALLRIRACRKQLLSQRVIEGNWVMRIQERTVPMVMDNPSVGEDVGDDDLLDTYELGDALKGFPLVRQHNAIIHLEFSDRNNEPQTWVMLWMGNDEQSPMFRDTGQKEYKAVEVAR
mgnify:CR=1 FL=1